MCYTVYVDDEACETVGQLRAKMPKGIILPACEDWPIDKEDCCLCGINLPGTIEANGLVAFQTKPDMDFGDWSTKLSLSR